MSTEVFLAILFAAFIQASWNFFAKKSSANKIALLFVGWGLFGLFSVPITALFTDFSQFTHTSLLFIALSGILHAIYVVLLGWAYTVGDISTVFPIARGMGIALTTICAALLGFDEIPGWGYLGILCIVMGTFLIGLKELPRKGKSKGFVAALLVALAVSSYSLVDSRGVNHIPPLFFSAIMNLATVAFATPLLLTKLKQPTIEILKTRKLEAFFVAGAGSISYVIVLWAYTQSATAYVVALREFSIVIAAFLGIFFLKEELYKRKALGILLLIAGMLLIKSQ